MKKIEIQALKFSNLMLLGESLVDRNDNVNALSCFLEANKLSPGDAHVLTNIGIVYWCLKKPQEALVFLAEAEERLLKEQGMISGVVTYLIALNFQAIGQFERSWLVLRDLAERVITEKTFPGENDLFDLASKFAMIGNFRSAIKTICVLLSKKAILKVEYCREIAGVNA
jgi:hypothetical protein